MASTSRPTSSRINKLPDEVVNKIAAGEIIVRPANAVKEMLENSLDAKATEISIIVKSGGLGMVQIQDNGCGIKKDDMPIVCERFTTSKIEKFADLMTLTSFGFRGEALASISYIAKVRIITKTADAVCATQQEYSMGKPTGPPKHLAGNSGTTITVEDFFYNNPTRRSVLSSQSDEHARVQEIVTKYAMRYPNVGFTLKKFGEHVADLMTPANSSTLENAKILFKNTIARELLFVESESPKFQYKLNGYVSNANFSVKKYTFLLFINGRAVDCNELRKSLEMMYAQHLPKQSYPFIYLSLDMPPSLLDVNVHPTKAEVRFRFEKEIIASIFTAVQSRILNCQESRTFMVQTTLPRTLSSTSDTADLSCLSQASTIVPDKVLPGKMVRTDSRTQTLDAFIRPPSAIDMERKDETASQISCSSALISKPQKRPINFTSVLQLRQEVEENMDSELRRIFYEHKFVGCASENTGLIQHRTKLYAVNLRKLSAELFYQIALYDFANFGVIKLTNPLSLRDLLDLSMKWSDPPVDDPLERGEIIDAAVKVLKSKGRMTADYFCLQFTTDGNLVCLPMLIPNYVPPMAELPLYIGRLASEVKWDIEKECFRDIARVTADFYSFRRDYYTESVDAPDSWKWNVEHIVLPAVRAMLLPPKSMWSDNIIIQLADLPELYRVFERC